MPRGASEQLKLELNRRRVARADEAKGGVG